MQPHVIFYAVYAIAFLSYLLLSLFIIYHVIRYSADRTVMIFTILFFIVGTALLLFANTVSFLSIPFDQLIPSVPMPTYPSKSPF